MTKKEFLEIENKDGFDWAVHDLMTGLDSLKHEFRFIIDLDDVYKELNWEINENSFSNAIDILNALDVDYLEHEYKEQTQYWIFDLEMTGIIKPIKTIKDIEEFLDNEGGAENDN